MRTGGAMLTSRPSPDCLCGPLQPKELCRDLKLSYDMLSILDSPLDGTSIN